jgi:hypothetical protein
VAATSLAAVFLRAWRVTSLLQGNFGTDITPDGNIGEKRTRCFFTSAAERLRYDLIEARLE